MAQINITVDTATNQFVVTVNGTQIDNPYGVYIRHIEADAKYGVDEDVQVEIMTHKKDGDISVHTCIFAELEQYLAGKK